MRIITRLAFVVALAAALIFAGLWGYSWYKVKTAMDEVVNGAAAYADVRYSSIFVSPRLDGTVGVDGISIKPKMTSDLFKIQSVRLTLPGALYLVTRKKDEIPENVRLVVNGISLDLNSPLLISLSQMQKEALKAQGKQRNLLMSYETLGCGSIDSIGLDELTRMGYDTLSIDLDTQYHYAKFKNLLNVSAQVRLKGMQGYNMQAELRLTPSELLQGKLSNIVVDSARFDVIDGGYAALRNRFCAAQLSSTEKDYLSKNIELVSRELGASFPGEIAEAYMKVMQGSTMSIEIDPKPGTEFAALGSYPLKDALDMLGVKLVLGSQVVDFNKFEWGKTYSAVQPEEGKVEAKESAPSKPMPVAKPAYVRPDYHQTAPSELGRYVGYKVRLTTRAGLERAGIIEDADPASITLQQTVATGRGAMSFTIAIGDILSAEVYY